MIALYFTTDLEIPSDLIQEHLSIQETSDSKSITIFSRLNDCSCCFQIIEDGKTSKTFLSEAREQRRWRGLTLLTW